MSGATATAWDSTETGGDSSFGVNIDPPSQITVATITEAKYGTSKKGEDYVLVEFTIEDGTWVEYRGLTKNGQPSPGGIQSAKILMSDLGYPDVTFETLGAALDSLKGSGWNVQGIDSKDFNPRTGKPYRNTKIHGRSQPQKAPEAIAPQADVAVQAPVADDAAPF